MESTAQDRYDQLLRSGAQRLTSVQRRLFQAEVCLALCDGNPRQAEYHFGWGRQTVATGLHELQSGLHCLENFKARGRCRSEAKIPNWPPTFGPLSNPAVMRPRVEIDTSL